MTMLSVFNCVPTNPPDGQLYLTAVFEPCNVKGGVQQMLAPWAVIGLVVYSAGYPAFVLYVSANHFLSASCTMQVCPFFAEPIPKPRACNGRPTFASKEHGQ